VAGEAAFRELDLDVVTFIPAGSPWQKAEREVSHTGHRWAMTSRAVEGVEYFDADDREVRRDGWTYTVDTLAEFSDDEVALILGADAAAGLGSWHRCEEIIDRAEVAVMPRPGTDRELVEATGARVRWLDVPDLAISGTMLRRRRGEGGSIRFFVREAVYAYIVEHDLYAEG
jgi:nicotinate-nucleotide adenylyltransferase